VGEKVVETLLEFNKNFKWALWQQICPFDNDERISAIKDLLTRKKEELREFLTEEQFDTVYLFFTIPRGSQTSLSMAIRQIRASVNPYFV